MKYYVEIGRTEIGLEITQTQQGTLVRPIEQLDTDEATPVDFAVVHANVDTGEGLYSIIAGGRSYQLYLEPTDQGFRVALGRERLVMSVLTEREWRLRKSAPRQSAHAGQITISAPMPGLVKAVLVSVGDSVGKGQRLLVLEAMKMENDINSPADGKVTKIDVEPGAVVDGGKAMISIES
jgi:biotin carboxyl carrier protein